MNTKPHKEPKKPKGFKPDSKKGQRTQLISNKIKEMKENGFAWLTLVSKLFYSSPMRVKIIAPDPDKRWGGPALLKGKGGYRVVDITEKDGIKAWSENGKVFHIDERDVVAIIEEAHPRQNNE